jgi:hypothetical protein
VLAVNTTNLDNKDLINYLRLQGNVITPMIMNWWIQAHKEAMTQRQEYPTVLVFPSLIIS